MFSGLTGAGVPAFPIEPIGPQDHRLGGLSPAVNAVEAECQVVIRIAAVTLPEMIAGSKRLFSATRIRFLPW